MIRLVGKAAIVTGAAGGIGAAVCRALLREGALVAALDLRAEDVTKALDPDALRDGRALALACDVSEPAAVQHAVDESQSRFRRITTLVNIAGGSSPSDGPVTEAPEEEFWRVLRLDLYGTFLMCKFGIPLLEAGGGGSVINLTSVLAFQGASDKACYAAAKGGVVSMTRSMAAAHAQASVRVNAIAPGVVLTPRVRVMVEASPAAQALTERHLLGAVPADEVAAAVVYLASDEAAHTTGQVLRVDSGLSVQ